MNGVVKNTVDVGFGFVTAEGLDYFFHRSDLAGGTGFADLREGDEVNFEPVFPQPAKGPRAANVQQVATTAPEPAA